MFSLVRKNATFKGEQSRELVLDSESAASRSVQFEFLQQFLLFHSVSEDTGALSSIVCRTAPGAGIEEVPLKVIIDKYEVTTTKKFLYKKNPIIKSLKPHCSLQR